MSSELPPATNSRPQAALGGYVDVEIAGIKVEKLKVMEAKYKGRCALTGTAFEPGAVVGFKHRDAITPEQSAAIFAGKKAGHLMILVDTPTAEAAPPEPLGEPIACVPDPSRMKVFRETKSSKSKNSEWSSGNLSWKVVGHSCGWLGRTDAPPAHTHFPGELARCERLAREVAAHLRGIVLDSEGESGAFRAYFAAAIADDPPRTTIDVEVIQTVFGGTITPALQVVVEPMNEQGAWWNESVTNYWEEEEQAGVAARWRAFMKWFATVPGLHGHSFVLLEGGDDAPGAIFPRLVLALTDTGSLVGAASFLVQT